MPEIYLIEIDSYARITLNQDDYHNLGIIERDGCLNIKPALREMLDNEGANVRAHHGWHVARNGHCHAGYGSGYEGYIIFDNFNAASEYLENYFDVE